MPRSHLPRGTRTAESNASGAGAGRRRAPSTSGHRGRLLRRFLAQGLSGWPDYEAVERLLTYAIPRKDLKPLAKELCKRFGGVAGILDATPSDLTAVSGLGPRSAALLSLVRQLVTRYFETDLRRRDLLSSPEAVVRYCRAWLGGLPNESIRAIYVDTKNRLLGTAVLSEGTLDRAPLFPRRVVEGAREAQAARVLEGALSARAKGIVLVHNHPSGDVSPSPEDHALTEAVRRAVTPVGLLLLDHLIVSRTDHFSFRERGLLDPARAPA